METPSASEKKSIKELDKSEKRWEKIVGVGQIVMVISSLVAGVYIAPVIPHLISDIKKNKASDELCNALKNGEDLNDHFPTSWGPSSNINPPDYFADADLKGLIDCCWIFSDIFVERSCAAKSIISTNKTNKSATTVTIDFFKLMQAKNWSDLHDTTCGTQKEGTLK